MNFLKGAGLLVLGLAALVMWGVTTYINYVHALQIAAGSEHAHVMAVASGASDVLKGAVALGIVVAWRRKAVFAVISCILIWAACATWSVRSVVGYAAFTLEESEHSRISANDRAKDELQSLKDQLAIENTSLLLLRKDKASESRIEAQRAAIDKLREKISKADRGVGAINPVAASMSEQFGIDENWVKRINILGLLLLLEVCSNFGLVAFEPLFRRAKKEPEPVVETKPEPVKVEPQVVNNVVPIKVVVPPKLAVRTEKRIVELEEFVTDYIAAYGGMRIWTRALQHDFVTFCRNRDLDPPPMNNLGSALARFGFKRTARDREGKYYYEIPKELKTA